MTIFISDPKAIDIKLGVGGGGLFLKFLKSFFYFYFALNIKNKSQFI